MGVAKKLADKKNLQDLVPLNALSDARFAEVARKIVIEEVRKGRYLFRTGDRDNQSIYLLDGKINLIDGHRKVIGEVEAGTDISRYPIASQQPRTLSARAVTRVVIARIDSGLLDVLLTWDQTSSTEVTEIGADNNEDWMSQMLQSEAFIRIPPAAIQRLLIKMQSFPVHAGEVVISQGEEGDYFYTIHKGRCAVTRKSADGMETKLAELASGDCFGEEALVSDARRNATITMLTDGMLMCLAKKDFVELLQKPLVKHVDYSAAEKMIEDGAVWVDVRSTGEFENGAFEDSVNIPLSDLRGEMPELVYNAKYIICCDTGRRSTSAAFILSHKGFEVYVLDGGMNALSREMDGHDSPAPAGACDQAGAAPVAEVIDFNTKQEVATAAECPESAAIAEQIEAGTDDAQLEELAALRDEVETLRQQLDSRQETEQQLVNSNGQIDTLQEQKDLLQEQYAGLQEEHDEQVQQLAEQLEAAKEQLTGLQAQTEAVDLEKQRQLGQFEREQEDWQLQLGKLEQQLAGLGEQYEVAVAERDAGCEQIATLRATAESTAQDQQQAFEANGEQLESLRAEIAGLREQKLALEVQLDHAATTQQQAVQQLQAELDGLGEQKAELERGQTEEQQRAADLQQQLDTRLSGQAAELSEWQEKHHQLQEILDAVQEEKQGLDAQLNEQQQSRSNDQQQLQDTNEQLDRARDELLDLQQKVNTLQAEKRQLEVSRDEQQEVLGDNHADRQAAEEALTRQQQEWENDRTALQNEVEQHKSTVDELRRELENAHELASRDKLRLEEEFKLRSDKNMEHLDKQEVRLAELKQVQAGLKEELELALAERDSVKQQHETASKNEITLRQEADGLKEQLDRLSGDVESEISNFNAQLESEQQRAELAEQQLQESVASVEAMRLTATEQENVLNAAHQEAEAFRQQLDAVQQELLSVREQSQTAAQDHEASLQQACDDLNRKNDTEKDMQGQISRLRKKLEQSATDLQQAREDTREQVAQVKEELRAERKARSDERADLAARQKELKEQLLAIGSTHEEVLSRQEGALAQAQDTARDEERARLKDVLDNQVEAQLGALQAELERAHEQADLAASQERERNVADITLAREQKAEAETVVAEQETRLQELTTERDAAVTEQQSIREQLNSLRAEVEVARGLIGGDGKDAVEDPVKLRAELEEVRRNMDIAMRVRSEAEVARDRAVAERDALQHQLDETGTDGMPLQIPSLDEQPDNSAVEAKTAQVTDSAAMPGATAVAAGASGTLANQSEPVSLVGRLRPWLGKAVGLVAVVVATFGFWYMLNSGSPMMYLIGPVAVEVSEPVTAVAEAGNNSETTEAVVTPQPQPVVVAPEPEVVAVEPEPLVVVQPEITPVVAGRTFSDAMQDGGRGPVLVSLPAVAYMMGSSDASPNFEERPQHRVELSAFAISKHEVTFTEYDRFARATGRRLPYDEGWGRDDRPAINVSWKDATAYVAWLSKQTGHNYRLPSEAQWEFAARAGSETPHWWPGSAAEIPANCFDCGHATDGKTTVPVGSFAANGFGLLDIAGNVQEWVQDCHHRSYKGAPADGSAWLSADCSQRVVRGGAYTSPLDSLRGTKRAQLNQDTRLDNLGFRVVRSN